MLDQPCKDLCYHLTVWLQAQRPIVGNIHILCSFVILLAIAITPLSAATTASSLVLDELEHLLVDTGGANDGGFNRAITPCTNYVSGSQLLGRETAAQWIRVAFHDFVTADVTSGTGGIDASIGFETLRTENSGAAMNDSLGFFAPFVNQHVSMADLIALSVVTSVGACGGPRIPLRGGRIDAAGAGPFGVPEPETGINETLAEFLGAGFDKSDSIALTACGHTMGSVHNGGFPQVVPPSAITPNNTGGGVHFDATPGLFDIDVVKEYLTWTGQQGGPLVTTNNVTVRSDLRLYTSDNNKTMQRLSQSSNYFAQTCTNLFSRMIDTVPREVQLTEPVQPMLFKPVNVSLGLNWAGNMSFSGAIRYLQSVSSTPESNLHITYKTRKGDVATTPVTATYVASSDNIGSSLFGTTYYYRFSVSLDSTEGISAFTVSMNDYPRQDTVFWLPNLSSVVSNSDGLSAVNITAAVLTSIRPSSVNATISVPSAQSGTLSPRIAQQSVPLAEIGAAGLYTIYSAILEVDSGSVYRSSVDIATHFSRVVVVDEFRRLSALEVTRNRRTHVVDDKYGIQIDVGLVK